MLESDIYTVHFFQCTELFGVKSVIISRIVSHFQNCRNIIYIYMEKRVIVIFDFLKCLLC